MNFNLIDLHNWKRKEMFDHFINQQTTYSMTTEIEVSSLLRDLKERQYKFYPAFIFMVTTVVNLNTAFRTSFNQKKQLGYWNKLEPMYTIFNRESETFSGIWTEVNKDYINFYRNYLHDVEKYTGSDLLFPKKPVPENIVSVSMIPWTSFTGFNLNINSNPNYLLPIVTAGKFIQKGSSTYLPVSLQVHHAVCDGFHAGFFMNQIQNLANTSFEWLS